MEKIAYGLRMGQVARLRQNVFVPGKPALTATRGLAWAARCTLRKEATIPLWRGGPRMRLAPRLWSYGSTSLYMKRLEYEPELRMLARLVSPGDVVLDIGANYGVYSLTLADRCRPNGVVHAFEPGTEALSQLRYNAKVLNPNLPIHIHPLALSSTTGVASLHHINGAPVTFSMSRDSTEALPMEQVSTMRLDEWADREQLARVDVVKIDVEGHEPEVFKGGLELLGRHRPHILFEVSSGALMRAGSTAWEPWNLLASLDYEFYVCTTGDLRRVLEPVNGNILAMPSGRL